MIAPGSTIGILGGGQLGRMLILAGRALGYRFYVFDPSAEAPAVGSQIKAIRLTIVINRPSVSSRMRWM